MKFEDFLNKIKQDSLKFSEKVTCFVGDECQILFFRYLFDQLEKESKLPAGFKSLDINAKDKPSFYSNLKQSFLGQSNFYWLGDLAQKVSSKNRDEILKFLSSYQGPHFVSFFLSKNEKVSSGLLKNIEIVEIEDRVGKQVFLKLLDAFKIKLNPQKLNIICNKVFFNSTYSLDESFMMMRYFEVINMRYINEFYDYLTLILGSQQSLYSLSDAFFSKNEKAFFSLWQDINDDYSDMFWVSFWSDQIFKAYHVVKFLKKKDFARAKRISFRLPYNFIKMDHKRFCAEKLVDSYEFLFSIDFAIKKGSSFCSLDLFYLNNFVNN